MTISEMTRTPATGAHGATASLYGTQARGVVVELDEIVSRSRQKSRLRRRVHCVGGVLAKWLDRLVPAEAPRVDPGLPPEIRFPFF
jgi:hypothetical protein